LTGLAGIMVLASIAKIIDYMAIKKESVLPTNN
jgi:hypothetical protein